jgi:hypothetical protein
MILPYAGFCQHCILGMSKSVIFEIKLRKKNLDLDLNIDVFYAELHDFLDNFNSKRNM